MPLFPFVTIQALNWVFGVPVENIVINLMASIGLIVGTGLLGSILVVLPSTGLLPKPEPKKYKFVQVSRTMVKKVEIPEYVDPGYETGITGVKLSTRLARFNPFLIASEADMAFWPEVVEEKEIWHTTSVIGVEAVEIFGQMQEFVVLPEPTCNDDAFPLSFALEKVEMPEIVEVEALIAKVDKVIEATESLLKEIEELTEEEIEELWGKKEEIDAPDHHDTCVCHVCAPFGLSEMGLRLPEPKANTKALLEELNYLDTIGNPDRADAFYSRGYKPVESDLPPGFYDDENLAQDWYDNQLYV